MRFFLGNIAVWKESGAHEAKARVLLIHGLGEHSGRYQYLVEHLTHHKIDVIRFDCRGAGQSGGRRQWIKHFEDYVEDTAEVLSWIHRELDTKPLFVFGHSLGGAIAIYFSKIYQKVIGGLILSAPAYLTGNAISPIKIFAARWLGRIVPTILVPSMDVCGLSRDPKVGADYLADPLACHFHTLQQGNAILGALPLLPSLSRHITIPVVIFHGTHDRVVRLEGSFELITSFGSSDRTLHMIPGAYHEPHNDLGKENYFTSLQQWIEQRIKACESKPESELISHKTPIAGRPYPEEMSND